MADNVLSFFHPILREWFLEKYGTPTDAQLKAWPIIASGKNVLVSAPTGSGKTLTAFLCAVNGLVSGQYSIGKASVLYISPLKALNNDVQKNLLSPLAEIKSRFEAKGIVFPEIRVLTRSGDTPSEDRRRMLRNPPEILITTPESLNLMLTSKSGRTLLTSIKTVILDEIHAVAGNKRGTYLLSAVERLTLLSGEFQRIGLSATARPLGKIALWMAGYARKGGGYEKRPIEIIESEDKRIIELSIESIGEANSGGEKKDSLWKELAKKLLSIIEQNKSTLIFTNSRRMAEKITRFINEGLDFPVAYSHHGSLSRELRLSVEEKMKAGELKAIVATGTLELGIDIGSISQVVLVQAPGAVSQTLQRVGRADHKVGGISRSVLFPTHGIDSLSAAVLSKMAALGDIEETHPIQNPLDVLAQILLSMTIREEWLTEELYAFIRTIAAFHSLPRKLFDLTISMLSGRYADTPLRELKPRLIQDPLRGTIRAKEGLEFLLYQSGGVIPDRGYYHLRHAESKAFIGELDEEFVWERQLGDQFAFGTQAWKIVHISHNDVEVVPADPKAGILPFWKAEEQNRDFYLSERIGLFLEEADSEIKETEKFQKLLTQEYFMKPEASEKLTQFLSFQKEITGEDLPHRYHVLMERFKDPSAPLETSQLVMHSFWGGKVNRPFALALSEAYEKKYSAPLEFFAGNDNILFIIPESLHPKDLLQLVNSDNLEKLLRAKLEKTALFGAHFRENAGRALLLPRGDMKHRYPLWLNRLRAKKLLDAVKLYEDFPILIESWRECLDDEFDLPNLRLILDELNSGRIATSVCKPANPSPFCSGIIWGETNYYMYLDDSPASGKISSLSDEIFRELLQDAALRPKIPLKLAQLLEDKLSRTAEGYQPESAPELLECLIDLIFIPVEHFELFSNFAKKQEDKNISKIKELKNVVRFRFPGAAKDFAALASELPRLIFLRGKSSTDFPLLQSVIPEAHNSALNWIKSHPHKSETGDTSLLLSEWLKFKGPVSLGEIKLFLGLDSEEALLLLEELDKNGQIVSGALIEGLEENLFCDSENYERLLRMLRSSQRQNTRESFVPLSIQKMILFLAYWQGLTEPKNGLEGLQNALEPLFGFPLSAGLWEESILPARLSPYYTSWLDTLFQSYGVKWFGCSEQKLSFSFQEDLELFLESRPEADPVFSGLNAFLSLFDLAKHKGLKTAEASEKLWKLAWKGKASCDSFEVIRRGVFSGFKPLELDKNSPVRRGNFNRWETSRPLSGNWFPIIVEKSSDTIAEVEIAKERVRLLFRRYGVLFKEILIHELPLLRWSKIFRTLRLLELSGEILSGVFFEGIPGLQFASPEAFRILQKGLPENTLYFMNACDPASLCGKGLEAFAAILPKRLESNWIAFQGTEALMVLTKNGKELSTKIPPGDPALQEAFRFYSFFLTREYNPHRLVTIEKINGVSIGESGYEADLKKAGFTREYKGFTLRKKY
jgi:ATP-dependent Lhr-like helicase